MSSAGYSLTLLAVLLTAVVVRLMDDHLDYHFDSLIEGSKTSATLLGEAAFPYALLAFSVAVLLNAQVSAALFLGAYAVGMAGDLTRTLPVGLRGYQEGLLALLIGGLLAGIPVMAWAFALMVAVQCCDDFFDKIEDASSGNPNLCRRFGTGEVLMAGMLGLTVACLLNFRLSMGALIVSVFSELLWRWVTAHRDRRQRSYDCEEHNVLTDG